MAFRALILVAAALILMSFKGCQTTAEINTRVQQAAQAQGAAIARQPVLVLPAACTAVMERVKVRDEPWVVHSSRWNVAADNRDRLARDCQSWADDYNSRLPNK